MKSVVRFSLKQTVFLNVVFIILVVSGAFSILAIPKENTHTVDVGMVFVYTTYYGASADDVEQLVTTKIESALDDLEDVEYIQSHSLRNFSFVTVKFIDDSDYKDTYDELRFRSLNIKDELPQGASEPFFFYIDTHLWMPVINVNVTGDIPYESLKLLTEELKAELVNVPGVRNVALEGEFERQFHVSLAPDKLRRYGVTFAEVIAAIESASTKVPTGNFVSQGQEYMLDTGRQLASQQEVLGVIVKRSGDGSFVRIHDLVTNARMSHRDPLEIPSVNGLDTLRLRVVKEEKADAISIADGIKAAAAAFEERHTADGVRVIFTNDSTIEINDSIRILMSNLLIGLVMVMLILWWTLGWRNAMITAIGIPFSFLCAITIMYVTGISLNTISLASFVLVTGIMVDDAVIIMENIFRHIQMGKEKKEAIIDGTSEVMLPVINAALTTALAFLPMLLMTGSTGDFFGMIPKTVTFALCASLLEALLIVPLHFHDWGPEPKVSAKVSDDPFQHLESGIFAPIWRVYRKVLTTLLNHKVKTLSGVFGLFLVALMIFILSASGALSLIKVEFFQGNFYRYHVTIGMPQGTSIDQTDEVVRDLSRMIVDFGPQEAQSVSGFTGFYEEKDYTRFSGSNYGQLVITLPERKSLNFPDNPDNDPFQYLELVKERLNEHIAASYPENRRPFISVFVESDGPPTGKKVNIRVTGLTLDDALRGSTALRNYLESDEQFADLRELDDDSPTMHRTVRFIPRQETIYEYGLQPGMVSAMVAGALNGYEAGRFRAFDEEVDLVVRLARSDDQGNLEGAGLNEPLDVLDIPLIEHSASPLLLRDLVEVEYAMEPNVRTRYKGQPSITIRSDIAAGSKLAPTNIQYKVREFARNNPEIFTNTTLSFGGEFESTSKSYKSLGFAFLIAIMLIYMVLASQFNHYLQPVMILSAVPFALMGVIFGLFFTRTTFTIGSFMAVVGLAGVAVNNSLLLIEFMNNRREAGLSPRDAVIEACAARMRPVVITTVTTMLGLLPMAIGIPQKSISWSPLAMAFVSGIVSSTILTLLIVPVQYELVEKVQERFRRKT